jgi:hypothetical protein
VSYCVGGKHGLGAGYSLVVVSQQEVERSHGGFPVDVKAILGGRG